MAIKPIFARENMEAGGWQWGLGPEDFHKVQQGYACGRCLEDFNGVWRPKCPVCGNEIELVIEAPPEWKGQRR